MIKKQVGHLRGDVWDRLYQLNRFIAKFTRPRPADDGHTYEKLLAKLARADVKFIIVGGVAVALNGLVRTTEDVDILVGIG